MNLLIAEDEALIAIDINDVAEAAGFTVLGPFARAADGLTAISRAVPDVAILDVNLLDGLVFELADALRDRGVPLVFHSGHLTPKEMARRYPSAAFCPKPTATEYVVATAASLLSHAHGKSVYSDPVAG